MLATLVVVAALRASPVILARYYHLAEPLDGDLQFGQLRLDAV
jgi:hypothetical protein